MGTLVIIIVVAAVAYAFYVNSKKGQSSSGAPNYGASIVVQGVNKQSSELDPATLPKAWETITGDQLALKLSGSVTVTLQGPISAAQEVERYLIQTRGKYFRDRAPGLAMLMSRLNVEVPEIEAFRKSIISKVQRAAVAAVSQSRDIAELRATDPELLKDLLEEREEEAYVELDGRPSMWRVLDELRVPRPASLEGDDALLAKVNHDPTLLWVYSGFAGDKAKARRVAEGDSIEPWVGLVETGLAIRGAEIPAENLVSAYTLAELNAALKPEKPIRRKAAAVPLIAGAAANALPDIRRLFLVKPMDAESVRALEGFEWTRTQAALLLETVASAELAQVASLRAPPGTRGAHWSIYGDCCERAKRLQDRDTESNRRPSQLPPYHIGCGAHADVWVE